MSTLTESRLRLLQCNPQAMQMHSSNAISATGRQERDSIRQRICNFLLKKLWLPRIIYEALPYIYLVMGLTLLVSAVYTPGWTWVFPYAVLLGLACVHVSIALIALRYNSRRKKAGRTTGAQNPK